MSRAVPLLLLAACSGPAGTPTDTGEVPLDLEGAVFQLNPGALVVQDADPGLSDLLRLFFTRTVLLAVHGWSDTSMSVRLGFALDGSSPMVGDPCMETIELPAATVSGTTFEIGPEDTTFQGETTDYTIGRMHVTGEIGDDGGSLDAIALGGEVDLRQAEGFGTFGDADSLCETTASFGAACGPCADDAPYCLALEITGLSATAVEATLEPRSAIATTCPTE